MLVYKSKNGYEITPLADLSGGVRVERHRKDDFSEELSAEDVEILWKYLEAPEVAIATGIVATWSFPVVYTFDDRGNRSGIELVKTGHDLDDSVVDVLSELFVELGGVHPRILWERMIAAAARAMLSVDRTEAEVEAVWSDNVRRARWTKRAEAALTAVNEQSR